MEKKSANHSAGNLSEGLSREGFATVIQAAEYLQLSRATVYALMSAKQIAYAQFGTSRRIPWSALIEYGQRCTVPAN